MSKKAAKYLKKERLKQINPIQARTFVEPIDYDNFGKIMQKYTDKQLLKFAKFLQYRGKFLHPEQQVDEFKKMNK